MSWCLTAILGTKTMLSLQFMPAPRLRLLWTGSGYLKVKRPLQRDAPAPRKPL